jgi:hypothetical protein
MTMTLVVSPGGTALDLFNGADLRGWDGDSAIWKVEEGAIVGCVEEGTQVDDHTYLIWQGGQIGDFELSLKFRSDSGNSGIDYRAHKVVKGKNGKDLRWTLQGYQADIVANWIGSFYNWGLAGAQPGQFVIITTAPEEGDEQRAKVFPLADPHTVSGANYYKPDQWNDYTITARGEHVIHRINGFQAIEVMDLSRLRRSEGYLGLQVHAGSKRQVHKFKELRLKRFSHSFGRPVLLCKAPNRSALEVVGLDDARLTSRSDLAFEVCTPVDSMARTEERFSDFVLRFQFQPDANDLSVWLRVSEERSIGVSGIGRYSARIDHKGDYEFKVVEFEKSRHEDISHFDARWDDCEISLIGGELDVKIDGQIRAKAIECDRGSGTIGLTSNTGKILRNVVLIPVNP